MLCALVSFSIYTTRESTLSKRLSGIKSVTRITDTMFVPSMGNVELKNFGGSFLPIRSERILPPKYQY